ncbi:unnamed protein product, partial [Meganyctiphanes norvegica]
MDIEEFLRKVIVSMTADDLKAFLCSTDWWDHSFTIMEMMFLVWGIRLCIMVRKAPSEFNESRFISMAIYNEFLLTLFLNVSMLFLQSPANPDLLFIIFFCHTQLTITLLLALIFGSKAYLVLKGHGKAHQDDSINMSKTMGGNKYIGRGGVPGKAANNHSSNTSSEARMNEEIQEEFKRLYMQLESIKERNLRMGNRHLVTKIRAMQEAAKQADQINLKGSGQPAAINQQKPPTRESQRRPSTRRKYSDGVVIKPYVNNILDNRTDNNLCSSYKENTIALEAMVPSLVADSKNLNREHKLGDNINLKEINVEKKIPNEQRQLLNQQSISEHDLNSVEDEVVSHISKNSRDSSYDQKQYDKIHIPSSLSSQLSLDGGCRSAEILLQKSVSHNEIHTSVSPRVCRSLEHLEDGSGSGGAGATIHTGSLCSDYGVDAEDRSVRSAQSTPRRSAHHKFREVRDQEKARAFIMLNLSDRSTMTEEVTV